MIPLINFAKKSFFGLIFSATFIFIAACSSFFLAASDSEIRKISEEDHQFCVSRGLDFGEDALKTEIYWRCRIALAQSKIKIDAITPEEIRHNITIKKLIANITKDYNNSYENWGDSRNTLFDNNDHNSCITQGHNIDSLEQTTIEDYFMCRKRLINNQQIIPPYHKTEYFKRPQDSYSIGFAINKKTDKDIAKFEAMKAKYPKCVKFDFKSEEFQLCKNDYDQQKKCLSKIADLKFKRELQEKTSCQKKSYIRFPDSMLKEDNRRAEEIADAKISADLSNQSSFYSIGINADQLAKFKGEETASAKDDDKTASNNSDKNSSKKNPKDFNTKNNLYDKIDLTKLRQKFIFACQDAINPALVSYADKLQKECDAIVEKWEETNEQR